MAKTVEELQVLINANARGFQKELNKVQSQVGVLQGKTSKMSAGMGKGFAKMALRYASAGAIIAGTVKSIKISASRIEDENLFAVSMGKATEETRKWSDQVERSVGVSGAWLRKYSGIMTNMTASMGVSQQGAVKLGKGVSLLSQDLASFYNISPEQAFEKMQSAMAGMPRPLQELGIMVRQQELEQTALKMGIQKTNGEFTASQKAILTYNTVLNATKNAQCDLARTINTPMNQLRMLRTNVINLGVAIGNMFQPLLSVALPILNAIVIAATQAMQALAKLFGIKFDGGGSATAGIEKASAGVAGIGDQAGKATGKAKKLAKALAGFDEMNVIKEPSSGGSGGGGGGGSAGGGGGDIKIGEYDGALEGVKNKALEIVENIKKAFKDFFKDIDLKKIGKAFQRFGKDVSKFLKPAQKILSDLWDYVQPLVTWAGNELLPGFLNALGGAISFVGQVLSKAWSTVIRPFIDDFLVPIASFTGGVIVAVLNGIGNALQVIGDNETAVSVLTGLLEVGLALGAAFITAKIALEAYSIAQGAAIIVQSLFTAGMTPAIASISTLATRVGMATGNLTMMTTGMGLAQMGSMTLGSMITTSLGNLAAMVFSPLGIAVTGIAATFVAFKVAVEANNLATEEAKLKEQQRIDIFKLGQQTQDWYNESLKDSKKLMEDLAGLELSANEAELRWIEAVERAKKLRDKYNQALDSGKYSTEELHKMQLEMTIAEGRAKQAKEKLSEAQNKVKDNLKKTEDQQWKNIMAQEQGKLRALAEKGEYQKLSQALQDLAKSDQYYTDAHGKKTKMSKDDTKAMADFIGDQLARINDGNGKAWSSIWNKAKDNVDNLKKLNPKVFSHAKTSGENFGKGAVSGMESYNRRMYQAGWNQADQGIKGFNARARIKSPSREMMKSGKFIGEGAVIGVNSMNDAFAKANQKLAEAGMSSFDNYSLNTDLFDMESKFKSTLSGLTAQAESEIEVKEKELNTHVTVNIGEETLVDKIIDGINNKSFMQNGNVINI